MADGTESWDSTIVNHTLQKVAKGTFIVAFGTLIASILFFIVRLIIIRNWSQDEFGIYSLAMSIPTIIIVLSALGIKQGTVRNIAFYRNKNSERKVSEIMTITFTIFTIVGILGGIILFLLSDFIAVELFNEPELALPLKIFSTLIPLTKIINVLSSFFRGYDDIKPEIYYNYLIKAATFLFFVVVIIWLNFEFINVFYAFFVSMVICSVLITIHTFKRFSIKERLSRKNFNSETFKQLLVISLPLWGTALINVIVLRASSIILGGMEDMQSVALFEAAVPLGQIIYMPLTALSLIYMPIISGLHAKGNHNEIKRNYTILTKWVFFIALPIFITFFIFPAKILGFLFGQEYSIAAIALRIASFEGIFFALLGLNKNNLIATGKTIFITISYLIAATLTVILNYILIPEFGVNGAAISSLVSLTTANIIMSVALYKFTKIHPFSTNLIKPIIIFFGVVLGFYFVTKHLIFYGIAYVAFFYIVSCLTLLFSIFITKSIDEEDSNMVEILEEKTGLNLECIKDLFKKSM